MSDLRRHPAAPLPIDVDCFDCADRNRSVWCGLAEADLHAFNRIKQCSSFPAGSCIHHQDEGCQELMIVQDGSVAVRKTDRSGRSILLRLCFTGDSLGNRELLKGSRHAASAEALLDTTICRFERKAVLKVLEGNPGLRERFLGRISEELDAAEDDLLRTATFPVRSRLAHLLVDLKEPFGLAGKDGMIALLLPLSQQDLASLLGVRRETVARTLRALERDGVVELRGRTILIPDLDALLDEAERSVA